MCFCFPYLSCCGSLARRYQGLEISIIDHRFDMDLDHLGDGPKLELFVTSALGLNAATTTVTNAPATTREDKKQPTARYLLCGKFQVRPGRHWVRSYDFHRAWSYITGKRTSKSFSLALHTFLTNIKANAVPWTLRLTTWPHCLPAGVSTKAKGAFPTALEPRVQEQ